MAKLHHATLKSAVAIYMALLIAGKSEAEIKDAIALDEKKYDADSVDEIYAGLVIAGKAGEDNDPRGAAGDHKHATEPDKKGKKWHTVKTAFRDKDNFLLEYLPGADVSHFKADRLEMLVKNGLVEVK